MSISRLVATLVALSLVLAAMPTTFAQAFRADYFVSDTSGQAVYEDMAIKPQAVHLGGVTYVAYQGWLNDPYVAAYDHGTGTWDGPYKVGENPLKDGPNPLNTHGAPALHVDPDARRLHVLWGGHNRGEIRHAFTTGVSDLGRPVIEEGGWSAHQAFAGDATYPQVVSYETTQGPRIDLFYRVPVTLGWASRTVEASTPEGLPDAPEIPVLAGSAGQQPDGRGWYATVEAEASGRVHLAAISQLQNGSACPFDREEVYYLYREPGETRWRDVTGGLIGTDDDPTPKRANMYGTPALVFEKEGDSQNQVSLAIDGQGAPGLVFLTGEKHATGTESHTWMFARWDPKAAGDGGAWTASAVARTDHLMDSGSLDFPDSGNPDHVETFLVVEGSTGAGTADRRYVDRGGDIWRYWSMDGGVNWDRVAVRRADAARGVLYNDPQIVRSAAPGDPPFQGEARLLFCQWDSDGDNFINKVFLWGEDGVFAQNEFLPELERVWGEDRIETAVRVSERSFPLGPPLVPLGSPRASRTVFVATGLDFADALSAVPLAHAARAPMLFVSGTTLPSAVAEEITRLRGTHSRALDVVILGGTSAVSASIEAELKAHAHTRLVRRIDGRDRYEVSRKVALELEQLVGTPDGVFVASGTSFPDALAAAPVAAVKGYPMLLTRPESLNDDPRAVLSEFEPTAVFVVGGDGAVSPEVMWEIDLVVPGYTSRIAGDDRYATAVEVAKVGCTGVFGDSGVLSMDRFVIASGEVFPDALAGGVLAARLRGPIVLTRQAELPESTAGFLLDDAVEVLKAYTVGGPMAVSPASHQGVGEILQSNKSAQRP